MHAVIWLICWRGIRRTACRWRVVRRAVEEEHERAARAIGIEERDRRRARGCRTVRAVAAVGQVDVVVEELAPLPDHRRGAGHVRQGPVWAHTGLLITRALGRDAPAGVAPSSSYAAKATRRSWVSAAPRSSTNGLLPPPSMLRSSSPCAVAAAIATNAIAIECRRQITCHLHRRPCPG